MKLSEKDVWEMDTGHKPVDGATVYRVVELTKLQKVVKELQNFCRRNMDGYRSLASDINIGVELRLQYSDLGNEDMVVLNEIDELFGDIL